MIRALAAVLLALGPMAVAVAHEAEGPAPARAYALPEPGSYELPAIARVPEFSVLGPDGQAVPLLGLAPQQVAVVSFVYTRCGEGGGCPAALAVLQRLDRLVAADPALAGRVRLATVSFDPPYDTPARMTALRDALAPRGDWRFLTARDAEGIAPVLAAFGQDALPLVGDGERALGIYRHVLKVFLVDAEGAIRNVYSSGFLEPELLLVDAKTVLAAAGPKLAGGAPSERR